MSQDAKELRECPFCGKNPNFEQDNGDEDWSIACMGPCIEMPLIMSMNKRECVEAWNNAHCWKLLAEKEKELADLRAGRQNDDRDYRKLIKELESERKRRIEVERALREMALVLYAEAAYKKLLKMAHERNELRAKFQSVIGPAAPEQTERGCVCSGGLDIHRIDGPCYQVTDKPAADEKREGRP